MLDHEAALVVDGGLPAREAHERGVAEVARGLPRRADARQQAVELAEGDRRARAEEPQRVGPLPAATARRRAWVRATSRTGSSGCASVRSSTMDPLQLHEDRLGLEVGVEPVVAVLAAEARGLEAAERRRRVDRRPSVLT